MPWRRLHTCCSDCQTHCSALPRLGSRAPFSTLTLTRFVPSFASSKRLILSSSRNIWRFVNDSDRVPRYHEVDRLQYELSDSPSALKNWRVYFLEAMGRKATLHRQQCPATAGVLIEYPGCLKPSSPCSRVASPSRLTAVPTGVICATTWRSRSQRRAHSRRCGSEAEWLTWVEGKGFLFDDSWDHELVNENPNLRSVLIVDIARPMGGLCRTVHSVLQFIMGQTYARWGIAPECSLGPGHGRDFSLWVRPALIGRGTAPIYAQPH